VRGSWKIFRGEEKIKKSKKEKKNLFTKKEQHNVRSILNNNKNKIHLRI